MFSTKLAGALAVLAAVTAAPAAHASERANDSGAPLRAAADAYRESHPEMSAAAAEAAAAEQPSRKALYASVPLNRFGGAWYDAPSGVVHITTTTRQAADAAERRARELGVRVETKLVARTFDQLATQADALRGGAGQLGAAADGQVGIDVKTNRVVVAVPADKRPGLTAPAGVTLIDDPGVVAVPDVCTSRENCDTSIRAGIRPWVDNVGNFRCSVGFTARDFSTGLRWTLTAGHCNTGGFATWGTGANTIGPLLAAVDSGSIDASGIFVNDPAYTGQPGGEIYRDVAFGGTVGVDFQATSLATMVPGDTVCLAANKTEINGPNYCGELVSVSDPNVRGMAHVEGVDACGGDSGGGWYDLAGSVRTAYGLHSRSDTGCHGAPLTADSWFSPWPTVRNVVFPGLDIEV